jgi:hypothetical protein
VKEFPLAEPDGFLRPGRFAGRSQAYFCQTDSGRAYGATQLLKLAQHRQHAFEFSIEMDLVAGEAFEPVRVDGFAKCLLTDQRPVF